MDIYEYADIIGRELELTRYADQDGRWTCHFRNCDTKEGSLLRGEYGDAKSPVGSIQHYTSLIRGKTLVFDAYSEYRKEFKVPKDIKSPIK